VKSGKFNGNFGADAFDKQVSAGFDTQPQTPPDRSRKSARHKIMDLLARRNHSELELRQKLSRDYADEDIADALAFARENKWMTPPEELSTRVAEELGRKRKGHRYINQFLKAKGLPPVEKDVASELRLAREIATTKMGKPGPYDYEEQKKIHRLLANRGFDDDTIRRVFASRSEN
jgi:regulatory protein